MPIMAISGRLMMVAVMRAHTRGQTVYAQAGEIAEQALGGVRTVYAFSLQKRFVDRYNAMLRNAFSSDIQKKVAFGLGIGFFFFSLFSIVALGFWYGSRLVIDGTMAGQDGTVPS